MTGTPASDGSARVIASHAAEVDGNGSIPAGADPIAQLLQGFALAAAVYGEEEALSLGLAVLVSNAARGKNTGLCCMLLRANADLLECYRWQRPSIAPSPNTRSGSGATGEFWLPPL